MSVSEIGNIQFINAALFWPLLFFMIWRPRLRRWVALPILLFLAISVLTFRLIAASPPYPAVYLSGAPDGNGRALAAFTLTGKERTRVDLEVWRKNNPAARARTTTVVGAAHFARHTEIRWTVDSSTASLVVPAWELGEKGDDLAEKVLLQSELKP